MSCIRGNYNLVAKAIDRENMMYQDLSDWTTSPGSYIVNITRPAISQPVEVEVSGTITRITSEQIGTMTDGIYTFETESCGVRYKRYKGLFFGLQCCIKKAYTEIDREQRHRLRDVEDHLKMTQSAIERNDIALANDLYEITRKKLARIECDCGC